MNTARYSHAVVSTSDGDYHIAIGGLGSGYAVTTTVELFQSRAKDGTN